MQTECDAASETRLSSMSSTINICESGRAGKKWKEPGRGPVFQSFRASLRAGFEKVNICEFFVGLRRKRRCKTILGAIQGPFYGGKFRGFSGVFFQGKFWGVCERRASLLGDAPSTASLVIPAEAEIQKSTWRARTGAPAFQWCICPILTIQYKVKMKVAVYIAAVKAFVAAFKGELCSKIRIVTS